MDKYAEFLFPSLQIHVKLRKDMEQMNRKYTVIEVNLLQLYRCTDKSWKCVNKAFCFVLLIYLFGKQQCKNYCQNLI